MGNDTTMIQGSGTQPTSPGETKPVNVVTGGSEPQPTSHVFIDSQLIPVRVSGTQHVVLRVNTKRISEQQAIEKANESIRRRARG
jgi:hypothetical protein